MYELIVDRRIATNCHQRLRRALSTKAEQEVRSLSTPGGPIRDVTVFVRRDGAVRKVVGIRCGAISDNTRVSFQAA
ncbi:MAG: hypothetical protein K2Z80_33670, partial [Xanthobacteraceae bacterium]|nr:hypothetical protein [Xanthobacteraceae bacterium]